MKLTTLAVLKNGLELPLIIKGTTYAVLDAGKGVRQSVKIKDIGAYVHIRKPETLKDVAVLLWAKIVKNAKKLQSRTRRTFGAKILRGANG